MIQSLFLGRFTPLDECSVTIRSTQILSQIDTSSIVTFGLNFIAARTGGILTKAARPETATLRQVQLPPNNASAEEKAAFKKHSEITLKWKPDGGQSLGKVWNTRPRAVDGLAPQSRTDEPTTTIPIPYSDASAADAKEEVEEDLRFRPSKIFAVLPDASKCPSNEIAKEVLHALSAHHVYRSVPVAVHPPVRWASGSIRKIPDSLDLTDFHHRLSHSAPSAILGFTYSSIDTLSSVGTWIALPNSLVGLMGSCTELGLELLKDAPSKICARCAGTDHNSKFCTKIPVCLWCAQQGCIAIGKFPSVRCNSARCCAVCHSTAHFTRSCPVEMNAERINPQTVQRIVSELASDPESRKPRGPVPKRQHQNKASAHTGKSRRTPSSIGTNQNSFNAAPAAVLDRTPLPRAFVAAPTGAWTGGVPLMSPPSQPRQQPTHHPAAHQVPTPDRPQTDGLNQYYLNLIQELRTELSETKSQLARLLPAPTPPVPVVPSTAVGSTRPGTKRSRNATTHHPLSDQRAPPVLVGGVMQPPPNNAQFQAGAGPATAPAHPQPSNPANVPIPAIQSVLSQAQEDRVIALISASLDKFLARLSFLSPAPGASGVSVSGQPPGVQSNGNTSHDFR